MLSEFKKNTENSLKNLDYKWIALSNTTLGVLMFAIDSSILLISLPAIFRGIGINPLAPGEISYLLWTLMGYLVVSAVLLVFCGRLSDMYGRVKMYNLGFLIFTIGSILLFFVTGSGNFAAMQIIVFRIIQGIGGAFLFANSTAILTDAFPANERGFAMGINQVAYIGGNFLGLIIGGLLAPIDWRAVFFVSVPFGILGTVWAYKMLKEQSKIKTGQSLDIIGNLMLAVGLTSILIAITYGIIPYGNSSMGWTNPLVLWGFVLGIVLLILFVFYEQTIKYPLFNFDLFKIRSFSAGNLAGFLAATARGGLEFLLIIWLQGIWLPLHGFSFADTPLWAAIYMLPLTISFLIFGPLSGYLSDKYGAKYLATTGMAVTFIGFVGFLLLPVNFSYYPFAFILLLMGAGMGMFASPNTTAVMNSVPAEFRGVASGMRATLQNSAFSISIALIFSLVTIGVSTTLPHTVYTGLTGAGISSSIANQIASLPPTSALFASFLGYNPLKSLLPQATINSLSIAKQNTILSNSFFPNLISVSFKNGTGLAFEICAFITAIAAVASLLRGKRYVHKENGDSGSFISH